MSRIWSQGRGRTTVWLAGTLTSFCAIAWLTADPHSEESMVADTHVEVPLDDGERDVSEGEVPIIVTIRWGNTTLSERDASTAGNDQPVRWDGYLAMDCGSIKRAEALGFESNERDELRRGDGGDFLTPVVVGGQSRRVSWRSRVQSGWDGLRAHIRACNPTSAGQQNSTLLVYTEQRTYRARLDWSSNDFVSLKTGQPGQRLEVHIDAKLDARGLQGARITAAPEAPKQVAQLR